jgi:ribosome maturation factor RimP
MPDTSQQLRELISGPVAAYGLDLESVEQRRVGNRMQVRVAVDRDGGVDLDTVAELSREISELLDAHEAMLPHAYVLEVGSPGVDRPLSLPRHWRRSVGRLVKVATGEATFIGRVRHAGDESATLTVAGEDVLVVYGDVARAVVQVELNPPKGNE